VSQENVEIVREAHERFTETGQPIWERVDADTEVFDHDIPDAQNPYRGWDSYAIEVEHLIDAGDRVVSLFHIRAVGAGSGVSVKRGDAMVWAFRDGKLARLDYFNDQTEALEAAGLRE
jgi:hypothetical protein